jgi:hypothetical protein
VGAVARVGAEHAEVERRVRSWPGHQGGGRGRRSDSW